MAVSGKGEVKCLLCSVDVKSESVWTAHVNGRLHRDNAAKLRQKSAAAAAPKRSQPVLGGSILFDQK